MGESCIRRATVGARSRIPVLFGSYLFDMVSSYISIVSTLWSRMVAQFSLSALRLVMPLIWL